MNKLLLIIALLGLSSAAFRNHRRQAFFETATAQGDQLVSDFVRGFLVGTRLNQYNSQIQPCLQYDTAHDLLQSSAQHLQGQSLLSLLLGITEAGAALQVIPDAFNACNVQLPQDIDLQGALSLFQDPESFDYLPGQSLWINGFEVWPQIYLASDAVATGGRNAWYAFGKYLAKGLIHVALGPDDTLDANFAEYLNSQADFEANLNPAFEGMTLRDISSSLAGTLIEDNTFANADAPIDQLSEEESILLQTLPANYDWRTAYANCTRPVRDQGQCGSCWAFATTSALSDRICTNMTIKKMSPIINTDVSPQWSVSCDTQSFGCNGGYISKTWKYFEANGTYADSCNPYQSYSGVAPNPYTCAPGCTGAVKYYAYPKTTAVKNTVALIQASIYASGPLVCSMSVYEDFFYYSSGIYSYTSGALCGGHAVKVVGWGYDTASATNYWIVQNSWSTSWGENGFFRIKFGQVGIDSGCYAALADVGRSGH